MPLSSEPFSVADSLADAWDDMVRRNRLLQHENDPAPGASKAPFRPVAPDDRLPMDLWQRARSWQVSNGAFPAFRTAAPVGFSRPGSPVSTRSARVPPSGPLTGRPGPAARVARALNTIASAPNTSAQVSEDRVSGTLLRGPAGDVRARGRIAGLYRVGADGRLDPPTGRPEISVSGLKGEGIDLPAHVRFYNTPTGELDVDLSGSIGVGPLRVGKGVYVIGAPDAAKHR